MQAPSLPNCVILGKLLSSSLKNEHSNNTFLNLCEKAKENEQSKDEAEKRRGEGGWDGVREGGRKKDRKKGKKEEKGASFAGLNAK